MQVYLLLVWAKTAGSDLVLAEALYGSSLSPSQTLQEALQTCVAYTDTGMPYLARPISAATLDGVEQARSLAVCASPWLKQLATCIIDNARQELQAVAALQDVCNNKGLQSSAEAVQVCVCYRTSLWHQLWRQAFVCASFSSIGSHVVTHSAVAWRSPVQHVHGCKWQAGSL